MSRSFMNTLYDPLLPLPKEEQLYTEMLADADFLAVAPQIYHFLEKHGILELTPQFFQKHLKDRFNETFYLNLFIKNQTVHLLKKFEELEIQVIPLKGVFFSERYFGHLGARATSDIDLLIQFSDLEKAIEKVKSLGFNIEEDIITDHFHYSFSKKLPGSPIPLTVELHWDLLKENTANFEVNEFWNEATPYHSSKYIKELSNYHTFYLMCLHSWRHNLDSLRHYLDIVQLIHTIHEDIDYPQLINDAVSHQTSKRIIRTLSLVYQEFPHLQNKKEFQFGRSFIFKNRDLKGFRKYADFIDYQFLSYDKVKHSLQELKVWLRPLNK